MAKPFNKGLRIGHVHLCVGDLKRSIAFYRDVLGFDLLLEYSGAAFLSVDGYHHHLGLNTWRTKGMLPDGAPRPGLYHFALNYGSERDLAQAGVAILAAGHRFSGTTDHGTHIALYLSDPDGNGIELAWDRDPSYWAALFEEIIDPEKIARMHTPLDLNALLLKANLQPA